MQDTWLARMIVKYVTKNDNGDIGYSHPKKMQVAIEEVGYPRMVAAVVGGGLSKFVLRRRGDFYRIAGLGSVDTIVTDEPNDLLAAWCHGSGTELVVAG